MSILREVIHSVEEVEWNNLMERVPTLVKEVHSCKMEICKMLDEFYVEFIQKPVKIPHLAEKLLQCENELKVYISSCDQRMKKELKSSQIYNDFATLLVQAEKTLLICEEVNSCYHIHERLVDLRLHKNDCENSLQIKDEIEHTLRNTKSDLLLKYYSNHFTLMKSRIHYQFGEIFKAKFNFAMQDNFSSGYIIVDKNIDIENSIKMLLIHFEHIEQLDDLVQFIWAGIIAPIVTCSVQLTLKDNSMTFKIMKKKKSHYEHVFSRLHEVSSFLSTHMNIYIDTKKENTLLDYIGNQLKNQICPLIISTCFKNIETNITTSDSFDYNNFFQRVQDLQEGLKKVKLLTNDSLLEYAANLQENISKQSRDIFYRELKTIMSQTNYDIITVDSSEMPPMMISSVVQELHRLTEQILIATKKNKTRTNLPSDLLHYFISYTSNNINFKSPKEIALLHNNFIYMAHELGEWNILYSENKQNEIVPLFKDQQFLFQTLGEKMLHAFLMGENNEIKRQLQELNKDISAEDFEKILKRNLNVIDSLMNSWHDVLPKAVFNRCIGVCLNVLCTFLIEFISGFNSIEENLTKKITEAFTSILKSVEKYFVEEDLKEVVQCWEQFKVLFLILKSDLVEVEINKYHELLKIHFKAAFVKKIIKAIFKPSKTRDDILLELYN